MLLIVVKEIKIYHGTMKWGSGRRGFIQGLELEFTDGKRTSAGNTDSSNPFEIKDEKVKSISLWGMGSGQWDRTSEIYLETNKGTKLSAGAKDTKKKENEFKMSIGSGLLLGFQGRAGGCIDSLAPIFLKPVAKKYIDKVSYPDFDVSNKEFLEMQYLDRATSVWKGVSGTSKVQSERSFTTSNTWTTTTNIENSIGFSITAKIPLVSEATVSDTLTMGKEKSYESAETETKLLRCEQEVPMDDENDNFELRAIFYSGKQDVAYKGTFNVVTEDGQKFSFPTSGTLKQVMCSRVDVQIARIGEIGENDEPEFKSIKGGKGNEMRSLDDEDDVVDEERGAEDEAVENEDFNEAANYEDDTTGEQVEEYADDAQDNEDPTYNQNEDAEPEYQAEPEVEENESNEYNRDGAEEEPTDSNEYTQNEDAEEEPAERSYDQENENTGSDEYAENTEERSADATDEPEAENEYAEETITEDREYQAEQSESNDYNEENVADESSEQVQEQYAPNEYNEDAYVVEPVEPVQETGYGDEYSESQQEKYKVQAQVSEYEVEEEREGGGYYDNNAGSRYQSHEASYA
ncbi:putative Natterin-like protein [Glarea lozoyensis 74030]|uniref:Putative Natterin-like protein n=1 Tax=Glarea lozoyensis (strain ATCC 74030 / MF5533) TaxID=1104152 RepID=H0EU39_GLAL7|nr:putative Natterin-like protein [Glarea lozoyensis 74030]